jgi:uncharacterized protein (DUF488 family)
MRHGRDVCSVSGSRIGGKYRCVQVFTVGHSTHELDPFVALLRQHGVEVIVDVRAYPGSRRHPQFGGEALAASLPAHGIEYRHLRALGGRRSSRPDSPNGGWENDAFRAYADHALGREFGTAFRELRTLAAARPAAVMCAEGMWWRCHRRLIADRLLVAGWEVCHIAPDGRLAAHELPPFAAPQPDGTVLYPPPGTLFA